MEELSPTQQNRLATLVCHLQSAVAAERLCFNQLFETTPDGYVETNLDGTVHHANDAMYQLLQLNTPCLNGRRLLTFFTSSSQSLILQRLRLLRTAAFDSPAFTDMRAQLTLSTDRLATVSVRLIVIASHDSSLSSIRWLIRQLP